MLNRYNFSWGLVSLCFVIWAFYGQLVNIQPHYAQTFYPRQNANSAELISEWHQLIASAANVPASEKLHRVNQFFNQHLLFMSDMDVWGVEDYWATPLEMMSRGAGDCEDFAIAKYVTLKMLGIPQESIRLIYVTAKTGTFSSQPHMVLGYYANPQEEPVILDNLISSIREAGSRKDLTPVYSFNLEGLWVTGTPQRISKEPLLRISLWRGLIDKMKLESY